MSQLKLNDAVSAISQVIAAAGGELVGRTRLHKTICLLELAGKGDGFNFIYKHYGPYSEDLATYVKVARFYGVLHEDEKVAEWGGKYSIFTTDEKLNEGTDQVRIDLVLAASSASLKALELAVTAAFLASTGVEDPWAETASRKPEKWDEKSEKEAKDLYLKLVSASQGALKPIN